MGKLKRRSSRSRSRAGLFVHWITSRSLEGPFRRKQVNTRLAVEVAFEGGSLRWESLLKSQIGILPDLPAYWHARRNLGAGFGSIPAWPPSEPLVFIGITGRDDWNPACQLPLFGAGAPQCRPTRS